jgi:AraC-like DNA-binding protein
VNWFREVVPINSSDDMREATRGADIEAMQLKPGKFQGSISHTLLGSMGLSVGQFSSDMRARGPMIQDPQMVGLGTLLSCAGSTIQSWEQTKVGDAVIFPAGVETDVIFGGSTTYLVVSVPIQELIAQVSEEGPLADPMFWSDKRVKLFHNNPLASQVVQRGLSGIVSGIESKRTPPSANAIDFLRRAILESFLMIIAGSSLQRGNERPYSTGARLVSEAEDYVDRAGSRPVHISELCTALNVSRRSLHRAFADTVDLGPVAYLRRRRLSRIRSILRQSDVNVTIADLAFEHGFPDPARFSAYYRAVMGETPSETRRSALHR